MRNHGQRVGLLGPTHPHALHAAQERIHLGLALLWHCSCAGAPQPFQGDFRGVPLWAGESLHGRGVGGGA